MADISYEVCDDGSHEKKFLLTPDAQTIDYGKIIVSRTGSTCETLRYCEYNIEIKEGSCEDNG